MVFYFVLLATESLMNVEDEGEIEDESLKCTGCTEEKDGCQCAKIIEKFKQLNSHLHSIGLMKKVAEPAFLSVIHAEVLVQLGTIQQCILMIINN